MEILTCEEIRARVGHIWKKYWKQDLHNLIAINDGLSVLALGLTIDSDKLLFWCCENE